MRPSEDSYLTKNNVLLLKKKGKGTSSKYLSNKTFGFIIVSALPIHLDGKYPETYGDENMDVYDIQ